MQQKAINLRPRYFKLMVTGICTRLIVTFVLSVSKEIRKEKLVVISNLVEEGNPMLVVGVHASQEGPLGAVGDKPCQPAHATVLFKCFENCIPSEYEIFMNLSSSSLC